MSCLLLRMPWRALAKLSLQLSALLIQDRMVEKKKKKILWLTKMKLACEETNIMTTRRKVLGGKGAFRDTPNSPVT